MAAKKPSSTKKPSKNEVMIDEVEGISLKDAVQIKRPKILSKRKVKK